jgi:predicted amidohydrolase YtcJ
MGKGTWTPYADLIVNHARIYTVDITIADIQAGKADFPIYNDGFTAVKDGQIIAVGAGDGMHLSGPQTEIIDAGGRTLIPGMTDCHIHAVFTGLDMLAVSLADVRDIGEFKARIGARAAKAPTGEWVMGNGWNELVWSEQQMPTRADLDAVSGDHPVCCTRVCHHLCVANSKALELAGITRDTPDPPGGRIGRDASGEPNGLFYENSAMTLLKSAIPEKTEEQYIQAIECAGQLLNSCGITNCIDANLPADAMRAYLQADKQGRLHYRVGLMYYLDKAQGDMPYHLNRLRDMPAVTGFGSDMVRMNGIKVTLDGVPTTGTAAMRQPYDHIPETAGALIYTREQMVEMGTLAGKYGWQIGIHCCGDYSADVALDTFEAANAAGSVDARHYIIHMTFMHPDQVRRLRDMNVPIAVQPAIGTLLGEQKILGQRLSDVYMLTRTAFEAGVIVGGSSSDSPVVPCNPFEGMYSAMTRGTPDGGVHLPDQRLTASQALIMWTKNAAYFTHDDGRMGAVAAGNLADFVLIDTPILETSPETVRRTKVWKTVLGGKVVYDAAE